MADDAKAILKKLRKTNARHYGITKVEYFFAIVAGAICSVYTWYPKERLQDQPETTDSK